MGSIQLFPASHIESSLLIRCPVIVETPIVFVEVIGYLAFPAALEARYNSDSSSTPRPNFSLISPAYIAPGDQIWR
ncbi:Protein CBG01768 [Caenorhabditis briggsae]|uniref:Protein CBG01768 n=1 Tax=Caenorhabditis briggsae TaxID=6238 RepID=A8WQW0_CAEBR|nr:Protein CBG01768 [Caenorhabditis briggsae]CAP22868.1 Protein CBG01768 [Caenorhabditis briggsae]